jgi:hypothetical protein
LEEEKSIRSIRNTAQFPSQGSFSSLQVPQFGLVWKEEKRRMPEYSPGSGRQVSKKLLLHSNRTAVVQVA